MSDADKLKRYEQALYSIAKRYHDWATCLGKKPPGYPSGMMAWAMADDALSALVETDYKSDVDFKQVYQYE